MKTELSPIGIRSAAPVAKAPLLMPPRVVRLLTANTYSGNLRFVDIQTRATHVTIVLTDILSYHGIPHGGINE